MCKGVLGLKENPSLDFAQEDGKCEEMMLFVNDIERERLSFHGSWPLKDGYL